MQRDALARRYTYLWTGETLAALLFAALLGWFAYRDGVWQHRVARTYSLAIALLLLMQGTVWWRLKLRLLNDGGREMPALGLAAGSWPPPPATAPALLGLPLPPGAAEEQVMVERHSFGAYRAYVRFALSPADLPVLLSDPAFQRVAPDGGPLTIFDNAQIGRTPVGEQVLRGRHAWWQPEQASALTLAYRSSAASVIACPRTDGRACRAPQIRPEGANAGGRACASSPDWRARAHCFTTAHPCSVVSSHTFAPLRPESGSTACGSPHVRWIKRRRSAGQELGI